MQINNKFTLVLILLVFLLPHTASADKGIPVKLAVIPFEVFSASDDTGLGREFSLMLSEKLALNPYIFISDIKDTTSVVQFVDQNIKTDRLPEIAKRLNANFILFGSVTKIGESISIDVQLYNYFPPREYAKSFAEGTEIDQLVESLATKVELDIMDKSAFVPPSQRLHVKKKSGDALDEDFIFAMERGIGETAKKDLSGVKKPSEQTVSEEHPDKHVSPEEELDQEFGSESAEAVSSSEDDLVRVHESDLSATRDHSPEETADAQPLKRRKHSKKRTFKIDTPVNITADSLEYDNRENRILFTGNVVARQGDIVMFSDNMDVLYNNKGDLKKISAFGSVKVTQGERIATGKTIVFYNQDQKIVVTGNPRVWQGDNVIQGKKITVFLKEDRSIVDGGPEARVNATIYPGKRK